MIRTHTTDEDLLGAALLAGPTVVGPVTGLVHDAISGRVWRLIARYGPGRGRTVAVPMEWVVRRTPEHVVLGVNIASLDKLPDYTERAQPLVGSIGLTSERIAQ